MKSEFWNQQTMKLGASLMRREDGVLLKDMIEWMKEVCFDT